MEVGILILTVGALVAMATMSWVRHRTWSHTPISGGFIVTLFLLVLVAVAIMSLGSTLAGIK